MVKSLPLVSIIITSYNKEKFIIESISSALNQSYQNIEIIIVDDASNDCSLKTILEFIKNESNCSLICNSTNQGVVFSRNIGISNSKGKYILPLDGDDIIANNYIKIAVDYMESHESCGICYCEAVKFESSSSYEKWNLPECCLETMFLRNCIFCTALFRRSDYNRIGGYDSDFYFGFEDWNFWLKILELNRSTYKIPQILFYYRKGTNERSNIANKNLKKAMQLIYQKNQWLLQRPEVLQKIATYVVNYESQEKKHLKIINKQRKFLIITYIILFILLAALIYINYL